MAMGHDYHRVNRYLTSLVKYKVCSIPPLIQESIPPNLVKINGLLKKWRAIRMLNLAFQPTRSRIQTTNFSDHQFIHRLTTEKFVQTHDFRRS